MGWVATPAQAITLGELVDSGDNFIVGEKKFTFDTCSIVTGGAGLATPFAECLAVIKNSEHVGYYVAEQVMFMNHWIRHSTQYPRYQLRLLDKHKVWFTDYGHTER